MNDSLEKLLIRLNAGDELAVRQMFVAFEPYMRMVIRRRISGSLRASSIRPMLCNRSGQILSRVCKNRNGHLPISINSARFCSK